MHVQAQVEKVLASWRKERVFSDAVTNACTAALGLHSLPNVVALTASQAKPSEAQTDFASLLDVATAAPDMQVASPANSLFSEPSAGSIDAAVLDAFPPKTVASANIEPLPRSGFTATHWVVTQSGVVCTVTTGSCCCSVHTHVLLLDVLLIAQCIRLLAPFLLLRAILWTALHMYWVVHITLLCCNTPL